MSSPVFRTTPSGCLTIEEEGKKQTYYIDISTFGNVTVCDSEMAFGFTVPIETWKAIVKSVDLLLQSPQTMTSLALELHGQPD